MVTSRHFYAVTETLVPVVTRFDTYVYGAMQKLILFYLSVLVNTVRCPQLIASLLISAVREIISKSLCSICISNAVQGVEFCWHLVFLAVMLTRPEGIRLRPESARLWTPWPGSNVTGAVIFKLK